MDIRDTHCKDVKLIKVSQDSVKQPTFVLAFSLWILLTDELIWRNEEDPTVTWVKVFSRISRLGAQEHGNSAKQSPRT